MAFIYHMIAPTLSRNEGKYSCVITFEVMHRFIGHMC